MLDEQRQVPRYIDMVATTNMCRVKAPGEKGLAEKDVHGFKANKTQDMERRDKNKRKIGNLNRFIN
jgi:hypothetical protein